jgi:putative ABC transport system ATP-binding protein
MIHIQKVSKTYMKNGKGRVQALQDVSLEIHSGEFVAIVGPSGSGKSTLMNILGLLDRPGEGSYILDGREVRGLDVDELARTRNQKIGFVFQSFHLLPRISALENVELPLIYSDHSQVRELAMQALQSVGLEKRFSHQPGELSGGEQQRVAIARALVNQPEILLADEPTGNLDSRAGLEVMAIFQELNGRGKTIVMITHDRDIANHAGRIVGIADGRIVEDRPVDRPRLAHEELAEREREKPAGMIPGKGGEK